MVGFKTVRDIDVRGKRVLLRTDYNVESPAGEIGEDFRINQTLPTIKYLLENGADGIVIISHMGRPKGSRQKSLSLGPIAACLSELLGQEVKFVSDCVGAAAAKAASELKVNEILVLENLRFDPGEEANDMDFAKQLVKASGAQIFVQDGFGVVHRRLASTDAITKLLPSAAGLLLEKEVTTILKVLNQPARPLTAVIGGAKISDKIELIKKFIELADCVAITGAMANNFLLADGHKLGRSLVEEEYLAATKEIIRLAEAMELKRPFNFIIPKDLVVSKTKDGLSPTRVVDISYSLADIEAYPKLPKENSHTVGLNEMVLDIGPITAARIAGIVQMSGSVIWNGTSGVTEVRGIAGAADPFSHGTRVIVEAIAGVSRHHKNKPCSLAGGGDTVSYIEQNKLLGEFNFVSTGGGAMLELLAGHQLPGIEVLQTR